MGCGIARFGRINPINLKIWVLLDANRIKTQELGLEEGLRAPEPLVADGDDLSVGKLVGLLQGGRGGSGLHLLLEVKGDIADEILLEEHRARVVAV